MEGSLGKAGDSTSRRPGSLPNPYILLSRLVPGTLQAMPLQPRALKVLAALLGGYALLVLGGLLWPPLQQVSGVLILVPFLSVHFFHRLGIPVLLEHGGMCGWGWCSPTPFGWAFLVLFWLGVAWLAAWGVARLPLARN
jgi:hypothetical protein